jgi:formylglycine-generating enzyme required for sulfatase activity
VKANEKQPVAKKSGRKEPFPGEDPANVFVAGDSAEPMETAAPPPFLPGEQLVVLVGDSKVAPNHLAVGTAVAPTSFPPRPDFKLPTGFTALAHFGYAEDGLPRRIRCDKDNSVMALVSGGGATVGADDGPPEARPAWSAFLEPFYMDVTEVTVAEFNRFREDQRENKKRIPLPPANESAGPHFPALGIPWGDANAYVRWLDKELPTEAEWEKSARGPDGLRTVWGNGREVWPGPRTPQTITAVGTYSGDQSVYGVFDLAGNAREWTSDWFAADAHQEVAASSGRLARNWPGPRKAGIPGHRVIKGNGPDWSAWHRGSAEMSARLPDVGFRGIVRTPLQVPAESSPSTKSSKKAG